MLYQLGRCLRVSQLLIFGAWLLLGSSSCVTHQAEPPSALKTSPSRQGLIWEATRGAQVITLVGTMHVGVSPTEIPKWLWTRLDRADILVTEVNLAGMNGTLSRRYLLLPDQQDLASLMGSEDWQHLRRIVLAAFPQIAEAQLRRMSPLAACSTLMLAEAQLAQKASETAADSQANLRDQVSMDQYIMDKAQAKGKTLRTFETLDEQFAFLENVFTLEQLRDMLEESAENQAFYKQLAASFKDGDLEAIDTMVATMPQNLREILLDQRNRNWGRKMDRLLSPKETFIAVGAAHLGGPTGLINILAAQGFRMKALKP